MLNCWPWSRFFVSCKTVYQWETTYCHFTSNMTYDSSTCLIINLDGYITYINGKPTIINKHNLRIAHLAVTKFCCLIRCNIIKPSCIIDNTIWKIFSASVVYYIFWILPFIYTYLIFATVSDIRDGWSAFFTVWTN